MPKPVRIEMVHDREITSISITKLSVIPWRIQDRHFCHDGGYLINPKRCVSAASVERLRSILDTLGWRKEEPPGDPWREIFYRDSMRIEEFATCCGC